MFDPLPLPLLLLVVFVPLALVSSSELLLLLLLLMYSLGRLLVAGETWQSPVVGESLLSFTCCWYAGCLVFGDDELDDEDEIDDDDGLALGDEPFEFEMVTLTIDPSAASYAADADVADVVVTLNGDKCESNLAAGAALLWFLTFTVNGLLVS